MSDYEYLTADRKITDKPCILYSVLVTTDGGGPGKVEIYDAAGAVTVQKVATLLCAANLSIHFRWKGLVLTRGLYVDIVEKADYVTVEWEPLPRGGEQKDWLELLKESLP
jgi:hypothetical protein